MHPAMGLSVAPIKPCYLDSLPAACRPLL